MKNPFGNGPYNGTWNDDPFDLRCIRLDAELDERDTEEGEEC